MVLFVTMFSFLFISMFSGTVIAQNGSSKPDTIAGWGVGLYKTERSFFKRQPSETKQFSIDPVYVVSKMKDSVVVGYKYNYLDSSFRKRNYYGVFDGRDFYLRIKFDLLKKFDQLGKYPFITLMKGRDIPFYNDLGYLAIGLADYLLAGVNEEIWYFNKKGTFLQATKQAMFFLLANDKDLLAQFEAEKTYNNNVFRKYLLKMNERYPH